MSLPSSVIVDLDENYASVGGKRISVARVNPLESLPDTQGTSRVQVGGDTGPILRPLLFGERLDAVSAALQSDDPPDQLAKIITKRATCRDGNQDPEIIAALALYLAGAGETDLPFAETVRAVIRNTEISLDDIARCEASWVDRAALSTLPQTPHEGDWNRIIFATEQDTQAIILRLANSLLVRYRETPVSDNTRSAVPSAPVEDSASALTERAWRSSQDNRLDDQGWQSFQSEAARRGVPEGSAARAAPPPQPLDDAPHAIRLGSTAFGLVSAPASVRRSEGKPNFPSRPVTEATSDEQPRLDAGEPAGAREPRSLADRVHAESPFTHTGETWTAGDIGSPETGWDGPAWPSVQRSERISGVLGFSERSSTRQGNGIAAGDAAPMLHKQLRRIDTGWGASESGLMPRSGPSAKMPSAGFDLEDIADDLALLLQHESDLRGIDP